MSFTVWDLTEKEDKVLSILLKTQKPTPVRDIYNKLQVTRYYVYEILKRLKDLELVEEINAKPVKYQSTIQLLRKKLQKRDAELASSWQALQTAPQEEVLTYLGLNEVEKAILNVLAREANMPLTILEIKEKTGQSKSLVERYLKNLRSRKLIRRSRGSNQGFVYAMNPLDKIVEGFIRNEQTDWSQRKARLEAQIEQFGGNEKTKDFLDLTLRDLQARVPRQAWMNIIKEIPTSIKTPFIAPSTPAPKIVKTFPSIDDDHIIF